MNNFNWMTFLLAQNAAKELPKDKKNLFGFMAGMAGPNIVAAMPAITLAQREVAVQERATAVQERDAAVQERDAHPPLFTEAEVDTKIEDALKGIELGDQQIASIKDALKQDLLDNKFTLAPVPPIL